MSKRRRFSGELKAKIALEALRGDRTAEPCVVRRHHLHPGAARRPLPGGDHGLGEPPCSGLAAVEHAGRGVLHGGAGGDLQHRPGQPVHQFRLHQAATRRRHPHLEGRPRPVHGQHLHRAAVALAQVRGSLPVRDRRRLHGPARHRRVDRLLQHREASLGAGRANPGRGLARRHACGYGGQAAARLDHHIHRRNSSNRKKDSRGL